MAKAPAAENKEVAVKEENLPVDVSAYEQYSGQGFENTSSEDFSIPFLGVLQGISPEIETLEGAKPGMLINTVTQDLYKGQDGVVYVPCVTEHCFVEWKPRDQGGGFVAVHQLDSDLVINAKEKQEFGQFKTPSGNDLIETFYVYGTRVSEAGGEQMVLAFTSTKIKKYKAWLTKARNLQITVKDAQGRVVRRITPPLFAHKYRVKTVKEKNNKGEFYNFDITFDGADAASCRIDPRSELFESCVAVAQIVKDGKVKVAHQTQQRETGAGENGGQMKSGGGEDPPF